MNERCFVENTDAGQEGREEKGVGKLLSQELEISVLVLILCGTIYGRNRELPIVMLGEREVSNPISQL